MQRVIWLLLFSAVCVGCAQKEPPQVPNVALEPEKPPETKPAFAPPEPQPKTFALAYAKLWDPKIAEQFDPQAAAKAILAERSFATHQNQCLAAATVGSAVALAQGGLHGVVAPSALAAVYPDVAKKMESEWTDRIAQSPVTAAPMLNSSTSTAGASTRVLVFRVKNDTNDTLRTRFDEYAARVEEAVKGTGATISAHRRGGMRVTGALSEILYQGETRTGSVRSVIVRWFDENDSEFTGLLNEAVQGRNSGLFKSVMTADVGPYLVVSLKEQPR
jgi:hypothetical protein